MTAMPQPASPLDVAPYYFQPDDSYALKYDAWNRLVAVEVSPDYRAQYEYDGLGRRIVRTVYDHTGLLADRFHDYYNEAWQLVEERREEGGVEAEEPLWRYVWHPVYVDALAMRVGSGGERWFVQDAN